MSYGPARQVQIDPRPHLLTRAHYVKSKYIPPAARVASCRTMILIGLMAAVQAQISGEDLLLCLSMHVVRGRLCAAAKWECFMKRTLDTNKRLLWWFLVTDLTKTQQVASVKQDRFLPINACSPEVHTETCLTQTVFLN